MTVIRIVLFLMFSASLAGAHEWYPPSCCSGGDCGPLADGRVSAVNGGYSVDQKIFVPRAEVKVSQDGRFHACFVLQDGVLIYSIRCFFAPDRGL